MAKRKIYDIVPPHIAHKVEHTIASLGAAPRKKRVHKSVVTHPKKEKRSPWALVVSGSAVVLLLVGVYLYQSLPWAEVKISPALSTNTLQETVTVDALATRVNVGQKMIPARFIEETKEGSQEFLATGNASNEGRATGTVRLYNKVSPAKPMALIAGTRLLSDSGKLFFTQQKVTIPAMKNKTAGSITVSVRAAEAGTDYNIGASKFSVPGLSGSSYYYVVWGESTEAMSGGYTGNVKKVTADDIETAKSVLTKKMLQDARASVESSISQDEILLQGAITTKTLEITTDAKANAIVEKFNASAKVRVSALVFNKADLQQFAKEAVVAKLPSGKSLLESSLAVDYTVDSIDLANKKEKIALKISSQDYYDIDAENLKGAFTRKLASEIEQELDLAYGDKISHVSVRFWPFWVVKAPRNEKRIKVDLNFDQ